MSCAELTLGSVERCLNTSRALQKYTFEVHGGFHQHRQQELEHLIRIHGGRIAASAPGSRSFVVQPCPKSGKQNMTPLQLLELILPRTKQSGHHAALPRHEADHTPSIGPSTALRLMVERCLQPAKSLIESWSDFATCDHFVDLPEPSLYVHRSKRTLKLPCRSSKALKTLCESAKDETDSDFGYENSSDEFSEREEMVSFSGRPIQIEPKILEPSQFEIRNHDWERMVADQTRPLLDKLGLLQNRSIQSTSLLYLSINSGADEEFTVDQGTSTVRLVIELPTMSTCPYTRDVHLGQAGATANTERLSGRTHASAYMHGVQCKVKFVNKKWAFRAALHYSVRLSSPAAPEIAPLAPVHFAGLRDVLKVWSKQMHIPTTTHQRRYPNRLLVPLEKTSNSEPANPNDLSKIARCVLNELERICTDVEVDIVLANLTIRTSGRLVGSVGFDDYSDDIHDLRDAGGPVNVSYYVYIAPKDRSHNVNIAVDPASIVCSDLIYTEQCDKENYDASPNTSEDGYPESSGDDDYYGKEVERRYERHWYRQVAILIPSVNRYDFELDTKAAL
ncbi:hypothetical protein CLAFUW4_06234 [Fulvia fulva]|uniref:Uncharacterized protein n=1 Tax=Passalora fulva TaxID=5499 RepID=A0A9Q8LHR1_PASFU|nr:uncharacterized protein CLAFUR5_06377 [Fulvia fulva]KAK4623918.1 hypothetical protein CLAFUR4_06237 [Fulvia fulva]KAK4625347.1 hypothetical protein CLAFUR0_06241 [Fulvia fulva]UJO17674.1 hypothetical protein CLAFUR5_06377 [Fulvia fulva]WPV14612.1 hypothetical protein CLAFUW4_06234 [Fulvia fulva]WPV30111.1 hypothetical protein CLAFUW7_06230 [Fulvia fulva]